MSTTQTDTKVVGRETVNETYKKKTGRFLFWKTEWWEKVSTEHVANDIFIIANRPIRAIIFNGKEIKL